MGCARWANVGGCVACLLLRRCASFLTPPHSPSPALTPHPILLGTSLRPFLILCTRPRSATRRSSTRTSTNGKVLYQMALPPDTLRLETYTTLQRACFVHTHRQWFARNAPLHRSTLSLSHSTPFAPTLAHPCSPLLSTLFALPPLPPLASARTRRFGRSTPSSWRG